MRSVAVALLLLGCQAQTVEMVVQLTVAPDSQCAEPGNGQGDFQRREMRGGPCARARPDGQPIHSVRDADLMVVDLFVPSGAAVGSCEECLVDPALCAPAREPNRALLCGQPRGSIDDVNRSLAGLLLDGLDDALPYCLRVVALDRADVAGPPFGGPLEVCDDSTRSSYESGQLAADATLCSLSPPIALSVAGGLLRLERHGCSRLEAIDAACLACDQGGCDLVCDSLPSNVCDETNPNLQPIDLAACMAI